MSDRDAQLTMGCCRCCSATSGGPRLDVTETVAAPQASFVVVDARTEVLYGREGLGLARSTVCGRHGALADLHNDGSTELVKKRLPDDGA